MSTESRTVLEIIDKDRYVVKWKTSILEKLVLFDNTKCTGCGVCASVCPVNAIELGPIQEIVEGKIESPKIIIDETKCVICPVCSSVCMFNALVYEVKVPHFKYPSIPKVRGTIKIDEGKCIGCKICKTVCPTSAINIKLKVTPKEELVEYLSSVNKKAKGRITIDKSKCVYCGLCEELCKAIKIVWNDRNSIKAPDYSYAVDIVVDEENCDYCGLCEKICPYNAINVECHDHAPRRILEPKIVERRIEVDLDKCIYCGICADKCPENAIYVEKPVTGIIEIQYNEKCDPAGCKNCLLACPTLAFYTPLNHSKGRIAVMDKYCVYCGACVNACPVNVITVRRTNVRVEPSDAPWSIAVNDLINLILDGYVRLVGEPRVKAKVKQVEASKEETEIWSTPKEFNVIRDKLVKLLKEISDPNEYKRFILKGLRRN